MQTNESCKYCEKILIRVEAEEPIDEPLKLPNTYDPVSKKYVWKKGDIMSYALIPRSISGKTAQLELFLCMDEDDMDDVNLIDYAEAFLRQRIFPFWQGAKKILLVQPILSSPVDLECWKLRHESIE